MLFKNPLNIFAGINLFNELICLYDENDNLSPIGLSVITESELNSYKKIVEVLESEESKSNNVTNIINFYNV
ncbi:hypothetical protein H8356DRAFT_1320479 [Neocallimastix lanati (nom. inval.)]|nr:hypothetical protein H8356DRAFT_1320479 [Neocallimastix sp. JGI-2020a]